MDDLDHRLIALLRADARQPISSLSAVLGISRSTVKFRIDRLLSQGVIQGFTVILRADVDSGAIRAVTMIEVEGQSADRVQNRLIGFPEVRSLHSTNGRWDFIVRIETETLEEFDSCLRRIRLVPGISATETNILLSSRKGELVL
jgi:DNA-binding Lrp family transcriptional regulator